MKTLWTFGDSFTFGWGLVEHKWHTEAAKRYLDKYVDSSKDKPWPNLLADKLNVKLENHAENGLSNYDIMDSHLIDLVGMEKFKTLIDYEYHFAHHPLYKQRQDKIINHLIYTLQEINEISGSHITSINELRPKDGIETVTNHTNWDIEDYHPSVNGHRAIAKLIHSNLMNDKREFLI